MSEADGVDGVVGVAVGVGGQGGGGAERDADDADGAGRGAVAGVGDDQLGEGGGEVCPDGRCSDRDGVDGRVELVGLRVDDADGAVGLVEDEGASAVCGHDAVDRPFADGEGGGDGVAGGLDGGERCRCRRDFPG